MEKNNEVKETFKSWMIAVGALFMTLIILCPFRLSGLVFVVLIDAYQTNRQLAAMPIFMFVVMASLLGPLTGMIGEKLGPEKTTLLGFLLAALGFSGVFFAKNMIVVIIFLGFVYGAGLALGSSLIPNILRKHFRKNFNSANGIVRAGSCVGAFIFPPIAIYLFDTYGTAGTFLIVAGIMLNGLPVAMLVMAAGRERKTPNASQKKLLHEVKETSISSEIKNKIDDGISTKDYISKSEVPQVHNSLQSSNVPQTKDPSKDANSEDRESERNISLPEAHNIENFETDANVSFGNIDATSVAKENFAIAELHDDKMGSLQTSLTERKHSNESHNTDNKHSKESNSEDSDEELNSSLNNFATLTASEANFRLNSKDDKEFNSSQINTIVTKRGVSEHNNVNEQSNEKAVQFSGGSPEENLTKKSNAPTKSPSKTKKQKFWSSLKIFTNPTFLVLMSLMSFLSYILIMVWATLIDYSRDKGIPREYEVYILMFLPMFDMFGRGGLVWLVDKGYVGYTMFQMTACLIAALSVLGMILCTSFAILMTYAAFFGVSTGAQLAIASGLVFKFLDKEEHMVGMTSRMILYVPLSFTAYPIIGYFRNELNSYDGVYYLVIGICLFCCAITPLLDRFSKAKKRKKMKVLEMEIVA